MTAGVTQDFLVKSLDAARVALPVQRVKARIGQVPANPRALVERVQLRADNNGAPLRWITVQQGRKLRLIALDDVCYFQADHKYVTVVTAHSQSLISVPLKDLLLRLDKDVFWQIHRSTDVNVHAVRSIKRGLSGRMSLSLKGRDEKLQVSARYAHLFRQW